MLIVYFTGNILAQNPVHKQYHSEEGLPGMEVYDIIQDKQGFIWIATSKGVSRFDGNRFENFTMENGLPDNEVIIIREDAIGRIWFITFTGPLAFYDGKIHNSSNTAFLKHLEFTQTIRDFTPFPSGEIVLSTKKNKYYCLKDTTLELYDTLQNKLKMNIKKDFDVSVFNSTTNLLLSTRNSGLYYEQNGDRHFIPNSKFYQEEHPKFITVDKEGFFWLSANDGCYRFSIDANKNLVSYHKYFEGFLINSVFEDKDHNFWFATRGEGVLMSPSLNIKVFDKSSGLADNNVSTAIKTKDGELICGTLNGNIHKISKDNKVVTTTNLKSLRVRKIVNDKVGKTWVGCEWNIFEMDKMFIKKSPNPVSSYKTISAAHDGGIYAGGLSRVYKIFEHYADTIFKHKTTIRFYSVCENTDGLLLGTEKGLYIFRQDSIQPFHQDRKPFKGWIDEMDKTKDGRILITTRDSGLAIMNGNNIEFINMEKGLQSNTCLTVFSDTLTNKIYLGTNKGLSVIDIDNNDFRIKNFGAGNGLQCGTIYSIFEQDGDILLCTDKGLLVFTEKDLKPTIEVPKVYINSIEINSKDVTLKPYYKLKHNENNIRIMYRGIDFHNPKSLQYRYRLLPIDTGWNSTYSNTIIYPDLSPDTYQFIVEVRTSTDGWSVDGSSFKFEITKPFWTSLWFMISVPSVLLFLIGFIINNRNIQKRKKAELATELVQTELMALRAQINPHFIFNSLNSIQDFIMDNDKKAANQYLTKFATLMRTILGNSSKKYISLSEEARFLNIYLELEGLRFFHKFAFSIFISDSVNEELNNLPPMILQPYLENAILHGLAPKEKEGLLTLNFSSENNYLICVIEDNGIGRKKAGEKKLSNNLTNHKSYAMKATDSRIEAINKSNPYKIQYEIIDLVDADGNGIGTKVILKFPQEINQN